MTRASVAVLALSTLLSACSEPIASPVGDELEVSALHTPRPFVVDEEQPVVDLTRFTYIVGVPGSGNVLAQTFSPLKNRRLGFIELPVSCQTNVLLNVKIRDGLGGAVLSERNNVIVGPQDGTFRLIQVADVASLREIKLKGDQLYSIELSAFPAPGAVTPECSIAAGPAGDSYARGQGFFVASLGGYFPLPTGAPGDSEDLPFKTLVR